MKLPESSRRFWKVAVLLAIALLCGVLNSIHQHMLFENDRHFSHLSTLEREMTFRTEMGLYYSYFKALIEAPTLTNGLHQIMNDNLTEYPDIINTLQRFNLYPEVVLGGLYRSFVMAADWLEVPTVTCWQVNRGDSLPPVTSCEGLGEPPYFYVTAVFCWNGLIPAILFLYGRLLSETALGGLLSVICFFFNHGECTRVQWTPPLRESFAYPVCLLQMMAVTSAVRLQGCSPKHVFIIASLTAVFISFWQFAQFVLLTQTLAVVGVYLVGVCPASNAKLVIQGQLIGLAISFLLLFGNKMLLTSLFTTTLFMTHIILLNKEKWLKVAWVQKVIDFILLTVGSLATKMALSHFLGVMDDAHIWNILRAKFSHYRDFHTMLYTCAVEFDFLEEKTIVQLVKTLLLPTATIAVLGVLVQVIWRLYKRRQQDVPADEVTHEFSDVLYNIFQLLAFATMAGLVMRLKLFFTPHLCIMASLLLSSRCFGFMSRSHLRLTVTTLILAMMSVQGFQNLKEQWNILGEYNNPALEELLMWINSNTPPDAVFAGAMPTMANIMLSTRRPIVNHPHYEDSNLRERTLKVYTLYSRQTPGEVHRILTDLLVTYAVLERSWCFRTGRPGCAMEEIWDMQDPDNRGKETTCSLLLRDPKPFIPVFRNDVYAVLKV